MRKRPISAKAKKRSQGHRAVLNIGIFLALLIPVLYFYFQAVISRKTLDPVTLCPPQPADVTVLLVDVTDPMNVPQRQDFINQLEELIGRIPRHGKLVVTKVNPISDRLLTPIITRCNPGSSSDVSQLTGNPEQIQRARQDSFLVPLRNAFDTLLSASGADRSPILESIQSVVLTEFRQPDVRAIPKHLVVASDLLQHTTSITFYTRLPAPSELIGSQTFNRLRADLRGVDVELWMLQRDDSNVMQPRLLPKLWERIIEAEKGTLRRVYVVSG
jgi:hypothetical protein